MEPTSCEVGSCLRAYPASGSEDLELGYGLGAGWILYQSIQIAHLLLNVCLLLCVAEERVAHLLQELDVCVELADADVELGHCSCAVRREELVATASAYIDLEALLAIAPALLLEVDRYALAKDFFVVLVSYRKLHVGC